MFPRLYVSHDCFFVAFDDAGRDWCNLFRDCTNLLSETDRPDILAPRKGDESVRKVPLWRPRAIVPPAGIGELAVERAAPIFGPPLCMIARNRQIVIDRESGMMLREIGAKWGISTERVRQIIGRHERNLARRRNNYPRFVSHLGRISGLPEDENYRDVWLTYYVSHDPRIDNYHPVSG